MQPHFHYISLSYPHKKQLISMYWNDRCTFGSNEDLWYFMLLFYLHRATPIKTKKYLCAQMANVIFFVLLSGGYVSNSLAIMTDAVHMLTDVVGILFSLMALWLSNKPPTKRFTFGLHRLGKSWISNALTRLLSTNLVAFYLHSKWWFIDVFTTTWCV